MSDERLYEVRAEVFARSYQDAELKLAARFLQSERGETVIPYEKWSKKDSDLHAELQRRTDAMGEMQGRLAAQTVPIPMILFCPDCGDRHIDQGEFATKPHHTHACQSCGFVWRPAVVATIGAQFLPGFKDAEPGELVMSYDPGTGHEKGVAMLVRKRSDGSMEIVDWATIKPTHAAPRPTAPTSPATEGEGLGGPAGEGT